PTVGHYGIARDRITTGGCEADKLIFFHGTTWPAKRYPESSWIRLAHLAREGKFRVLLPWDSDGERERAKRISAATGAVVMDKLSLAELAKEIATCRACIAVDSGLGHMACALDVPTLSLYGPTTPALTGTYGESQRVLPAKFHCAPCMQRK